MNNLRTDRDFDHLEKTSGDNRKIFHGISIVLLTVLFAALMIVLLLQDDADEAAFLHTAGCGMIMVMDIILAVSYSAGHYEVTDFQDRFFPHMGLQPGIIGVVQHHDP